MVVMGSIKVINFLARSIFAVYVVHQIPAFREFEWKTLCRAESLAGLPPLMYAISIVGITLAVFLAITVIDAARFALFSMAKRQNIFKQLINKHHAPIIPAIAPFKYAQAISSRWFFKATNA